MITPAHHRAKRVERYLDRKISGHCTQCAVDLTDDEGVMCSICVEAQSETRRKNSRRKSVRRKRLVRQREYRAKRIAAGVCVRCPHKTNGKRVLCDSCAADQAQRDARSHAMRKQGIVPIASAKRRPSYTPLDELLETPRIRLLRAIRQLEWSRSSELMDRLGVPSCTENVRVHDVYSQSLARLVSGGLVERRGAHPMSQYRITHEGRAELERIYALEKSA